MLVETQKMKSMLQRIAAILLFVALIALPVFVFANGDSDATCKGLVPCGCKGGPPCNACHFVQLFQNILNFLWYKISLPIAAAMFAYGGFLMVVASAKPATFEKGKKILLNTVIGVAIVFFAWLGVDTIMKLFGSKLIAGAEVPSEGQLGFGPWNQITCVYTPPPVVPGGGMTPGAGVIATDAAAAAKDVSAAASSGGLVLQGTGSCMSVSPASNISEAESGRPMTTCSSGCSPSSGCGGVGGGGFVAPSLDMLNGLAAFPRVTRCGAFTTTSISGGSHSGPSHYAGRSFDMVPSRSVNWDTCLGDMYAASQAGTIKGLSSSPTRCEDNSGKQVSCSVATHIHVEFQ